MYKMCFRVGQTEVDSYNIVHHPEYVKWAEKAFCEYMIVGGSPTPKYAIENINAKFIKAFRQYENVLVWIKQVKKTDKTYKVKFDIINSDDNDVYCKLVIEFKME